MFVGSHNLISLRNRQRQSHDTFDLAVHSDWRHHPHGGRSKLRLILLEFGDPEEIEIFEPQHFWYTSRRLDSL